MRLSQLLEKCTRREKTRKENREADYQKLVVQVADGKEPDIDWADEVLDHTDKTGKDLQEAAERLQHRRQLQQQVRDQPNLEKEAKRIEGEIAKADRLFEQANKRHDDTVDPLVAQFRQTRNRIREAEAARQELWATCEDQELLKQLEFVEFHSGKLRPQADSLHNDIFKYRGEEAVERDTACRCRDLLKTKQYEKQAAGYAEKAKPLETELANVRSQLAKLERQEKDIRDQMLKA